MQLEPEIVDKLEGRYGADCILSTFSDHPAGPPTSVMLSDGSVCRIRRLRPRGDWIARATSDERMRGYQLASSGIFRSLPAGVNTPVVDMVVLPGGAALIERVLPDSRPSTSEALERMVVGLARLHSAFVGFPARLTAGLGLSPLGAWLTLFSPAAVAREVDTPQEIAGGWSALRTRMPDLWERIEPLLANPASMVDDLRDYPATILHGNVAPGNVAITDDAVILSDWSQAVRGPGALDLGVVLVRYAPLLPGSIDATIRAYRVERARLGRLPSIGEAWDRELRLGVVAGLMRYGWILDEGVAVEAFERYLD